MEKNILGEKVKNLRTGKGYSQDHLSDLAQISLRTVQRIENGETDARGDTLNRLANALGVGIEELIEAPNTSSDHNGYLLLINLSALATLFLQFPFFGIILPLILWKVKQEQLTDVATQVKKVINFQITWVLVIVVFYILIMTNLLFLHIDLGFHIGALGASEILLLMPVLILPTNALQVIVNAFRIKMRKEVKYWPVIRFLK